MIYKLELNEAEIGVISKALGAAPYAEVATLISKLQRQINEQISPPAPSVLDSDSKE